MIKDIHFQIPLDIQVQLASGQYERIGGVIRDTHSKKVVAWLREMPTSSKNPSDMLGLGAMSMAKFGGLMNIGLVAASVVVINQRLDTFSNQLEDLKSITKAEFNRDRETEFRAALETAAGIATSQNETTKRQLAAEALSNLLKSVETFIDLTEEYLTISPVAANVYFSQAINASTACVRCSLEIQEYDTARQHISKHLRRFEKLSHSLIEKTLGEPSALYFHPGMQREEVERFIKVKQWIMPRSTFDIVNEVRHDFFNPALQESFWTKIFNPFSKRTDDRRSLLAQNLAQAELIIENINRLHGFEMEIRFLRLSNQSLDSWNHLLDDYVADEATSPLAVIELEEPILMHNLSDTKD
jgi:hypothetical protein